MAFIKVDRKMFNHWLWNTNEPFTKRGAWIDLLQMANFAPEPKKEFISDRLITTNRGQKAASVRFLAKRWKWKSNGKVTRFLNLLESDKMIEIKTEQGQQVITICKYDDYNPLQNTNSTLTEHKRNDVETPMERGRNKLKEGKEIEEGNNVKIKTSAASATEFDIFKNIVNSSLRIKKMERQLTDKEFQRLRIDYSMDQIKRGLEIMDNNKKLLNRSSVNLTLRNMMNREDGKPETSKWMPLFKAEYQKFMVQQTDGAISSPSYSAGETRALISLINYLQQNSVEKTYPGALKSFKYIIGKWDVLDVFTQKRIKISEINKDLSNIIVQIKQNGKRPQTHQGHNKSNSDKAKTSGPREY